VVDRPRPPRLREPRREAPAPAPAPAAATTPAAEGADSASPSLPSFKALLVHTFSFQPALNEPFVLETTGVIPLYNIFKTLEGSALIILA